MPPGVNIISETVAVVDGATLLWWYKTLLRTCVCKAVYMTMIMIYDNDKDTLSLPWLLFRNVSFPGRIFRWPVKMVSSVLMSFWSNDVIVHLVDTFGHFQFPTPWLASVCYLFHVSLSHSTSSPSKSGKVTRLFCVVLCEFVNEWRYNSVRMWTVLVKPSWRNSKVLDG